MDEQRLRAALDAAAKQLSYRALSADALRKKLLEKGHEEDAADYAVAWLQARGLLSEQALADSVVRAYSARGYGPARIRHELSRRAINRDAADGALSDFSADLDKMTALLHKRLKGDLSDKKEVDRAVAALQRRGFSWGDIRDALRAYGASLDDSFDE